MDARLMSALPAPAAMRRMPGRKASRIFTGLFIGCVSELRGPSLRFRQRFIVAERGGAGAENRALLLGLVEARSKQGGLAEVGVRDVGVGEVGVGQIRAGEAGARAS